MAHMVLPCWVEQPVRAYKARPQTVEDKEDVWTEVAYGEQLFSGRLGAGR